MQKTQKFLIILACSLAANLTWAECSRPDKPDTPNGKKASMEEMVAGQKDVKAFVADAEAYIACLEEEEKAELAAGAPETEEAKAAFMEKSKARLEKHNGAVEDMEVVAADFNNAIKEFKAK